MSLINELNNIIRNDKKSFGGVSEGDFTLKTGFENLDYLNGQIITTDLGEKQLFTGLSAGRVTMFIAKPGAGKSTLAIQTAVNIIKKYDEGLLYIFDFEQNNSKERVRMVTGISEDYYDKHVTIMRSGITTEAVLRTLSKIKEIKLAHEKELLVPNENGVRDLNGEVKKVLPPTVVIIDSLAMMMPADNLAEEDIQGQMAATSIARVNGQFFKKAVQICERANILLFMINHITQQIAIGITPPSSVVNFLKQDEAISGGKAALYVTDTLIKLTAGSKLEEDKSYGIKGYEVKVELAKSRHSAAGRAINMIYDQVNGFRNDLSMLDYIKSCGALKGNGMAYYIDGYPEYKFKSSNFAEKYNTTPEFKEIVENTAKELLKQSIRENMNIVYDDPNVDAPEEVLEVSQGTIDERVGENE